MVGIQDYKSILITGATSGIGRALAQSLTKLESKPRVIGVGRREDRLEELKKDGIEAIKFDTDTDEKGIQKFVDETLAKYPDVSLR
jgi:NADP-dependent 3-hydroxy acid dehydrogenase YdfG